MNYRFLLSCILLVTLLIATSCDKQVYRETSSDTNSSEPRVERTIRVEEPRVTPSSSPENIQAATCQVIQGAIGSQSYFPQADHPCAKTLDEVLEGAYEIASISMWASAADLGIQKVTWLHDLAEVGVPSESDAMNYHVTLMPEHFTDTAVRFPIRLPSRIMNSAEEISFEDEYLYDARVASIDRVAEVERLILVGPDHQEGAKFSEVLSDGILTEGRLYQGDFNYTREYVGEHLIREEADNTGSALVLQQLDGTLVIFSEYTTLNSESEGRPQVRLRLTYRKI